MNEILVHAALAIALLCWAAFFWLFGWVRRNRSTSSPVAGKDKGLLDALNSQGKHLDRLEKQLGELDSRQTAEAQEIAARLERAQETLHDQLEALSGYTAGALRHTHLHRYTAAGNGGPESYIVIAADDHGNGFLLNILTGKTARVYARDMTAWNVQKPSQEESQALQNARESKGG